ncbi:MAG: FAD binding domain-containing protein [Oscillospiraceae bacterium]|nr:FAD binding domain-containing protein [Oscillospiraceae bacterium]
MITIQNYVRAKSLQEAYELNAKRSARIIGGMMWLKTGDISIHTAIDLCDLGLDTICETEEEFSIGAMVTLRQLEQHPGFAAYTNGATEKAVKDIVGVQFRNMATVGGSIFGRFGFSDVMTLFLTMDTYVELYAGGTVTLEAFSRMKKDNDILVRLIVKKRPARFAYAAVRKSRTDFPVLSCAVSCVDGEHRVVIGARPAGAYLLRDEGGILAGGCSEEAIRRFSDLAAKTIPTAENLRGSAAYRTRLIRVLTERCLKEMEGEAHGN